MLPPLIVASTADSLFPPAVCRSTFLPASLPAGPLHFFLGMDCANFFSSYQEAPKLQEFVLLRNKFGQTTSTQALLLLLPPLPSPMYNYSLPLSPPTAALHCYFPRRSAILSRRAAPLRRGAPPCPPPAVPTPFAPNLTRLVIESNENLNGKYELPPL